MSSLTQIRTRVSIILQDAGTYFWSDAELDEAIRMALGEFQKAVPQKREAVYTLVTNGRDIPLPAAAFPDLLTVIDVFWPWDDTKSVENQDNYAWRWRVDALPGGPILRLNQFARWESGAGSPAAGQKMRLLYTCPHTIDGLDGAAATSLEAAHEVYIVRGAAAMAAAFAMLDRSEVQAPDDLRAWGWQRLNEYRADLKALSMEIIKHDSAIGAAWRMDRWDRGY